MTDAETEKCKAQIKRHEGLSLSAYQDSEGYPTIGYGRLLSDDKTLWPTFARMRVDKATADAYFEEDYEEAVKAAKSVMPFGAIAEAPRIAVLINMAYNMGVTKLAGFTQTLKYIRSRQYAKAADAMLASRWAKQTGVRAIELSLQTQRGEWLADDEIRALYSRKAKQ
jgi:lysozyme